MKTEYIQTVLAIALVAIMVAFMVMQPPNKILYVSFPLKAQLTPSIGQKIIQRVLQYGYKIERNDNTSNCITITKEITNNICLSSMAIRIETMYKAGEVEEAGIADFEPTNGEASARFENMKKVEAVLYAVLKENAVEHFPSEYSW